MGGRRNILFIIIDQLRADCLFGRLAPFVDLPNLRALMADGVYFANHHSVAAPCGPSRVSILTGQYAMNHRSVRNGTPLRHDVTNVALELRKLGYMPLLYGYTDVPRDPRTLPPGDPSLTTYEEVLAGFLPVVETQMEWNWAWRGYLKARGYDTPPYPDIYRPIGDAFDGPALYAAEDSDTAWLTDRFLEDIGGRPRGWCAHLTYIRPHPPLCAPAPYDRLIDPDSLPPPLPAIEGPAHPFDAAARAYRRAAHQVIGFPDLPDSPEVIARLRAIYLGLVAEVDHHVGRVIAHLKETGTYDDTLIVVTSDHGEMLGDHGFWNKTIYHEGAFHTPLIIRNGPMATRGRVVEAPVDSIDIAPTILDLVGAEVPDSMNGASLQPFLKGEAPGAWRPASFSEIDFGDPVAPTSMQSDLGLSARESSFAVLRAGNYTLVHFAAALPQLLLARQTDGSIRNITGAPGSDEISLDLSRRMLSHRMRYAEGTFARTMVTEAGVRTGDH